MIDMPEGWVPNDSASVDPQLETDLKDIKEHPPTQEELMPSIVEKLKECYDPEISVDIYNLGLIGGTGCAAGSGAGGGRLRRLPRRRSTSGCGDRAGGQIAH